MDFEDSLAALTQKEAAKIELALNEVEEKLYNPLPEKPIKEVVSTESDVYKEYMQSALAGYSAHNEDVCDEEVAMWQQNFMYLQVKGNAMLELDSEYEESVNEENDEGVSFVPMPFIQSEVYEGSTLADTSNSDNGNLRISGFAISLDQNCSSNQNITNDVGNVADKEEILYVDGILEECLLINHEPNESTFMDEADIYTSIEPSQCQQAEVINSLVDVIFPDIANLALRPLVTKVIRAGRKHNVQFVLDDDSQNNSDECKIYSHECEHDECMDYDNKDNSCNVVEYTKLVIPEGWD